MRDVSERTGMSRQAIRFYVTEGLVPPPTKTGQTTALYTEEHVERILLVKKLQEEHFLPLHAIRAMLDDEHQGFTPAQREVLRDVKARLPSATTGDDAPRDTVPIAPLLERTKLAKRELRDLDEAGLVTIVRNRIAADDVWLVELWADVRAAGFTRELGFGVELLLIFERGLARMFEEEKRVLAQLATKLPASSAAAMVDRALPLVHQLLVRRHQAMVRTLFSTLEAR